LTIFGINIFKELKGLNSITSSSEQNSREEKMANEDGFEGIFNHLIDEV